VPNAPPEDVWIPESLPTLAPGQEWRTFWDFTDERREVELPVEHMAEVTFADSHGETHSASYRLNWSPYTGRRWVVAHGEHEAAEALRGIEAEVRKWREGLHGLAVYVRDGDEKDRRKDEEQKRYRKEQKKAETADVARQDAPPEGNPD
jgi:hypothetical protein